MDSLKKFIERNKNYIKNDNVSFSIFEKYKDVLPNEITYIWQNYGFGVFEDGFIQFVNPEEYNPLLQYCDIYLDPTIVFAVTAMGDLIVWEGSGNSKIAEDEGNRYALYNFRKGKKIILSGNPVVLNIIIGDKEEIEDDEYFDSAIYYQAIVTNRPLNFGECYGFEPLLALGGSEKVENIKIVKTKEYLDIIGQTVGQID